MSVREPILKPVAIADLRPTQMTVECRLLRAIYAFWRTRRAFARTEFFRFRPSADIEAQSRSRHLSGNSSESSVRNCQLGVPVG
jgi:hypothetical protein